MAEKTKKDTQGDKNPGTKSFLDVTSEAENRNEEEKDDFLKIIARIRQDISQQSDQRDTMRSRKRMTAEGADLMDERSEVSVCCAAVIRVDSLPGPGGKHQIRTRVVGSAGGGPGSVPTTDDKTRGLKARNYWECRTPFVFTQAKPSWTTVDDEAGDKIDDERLYSVRQLKGKSDPS